MNKARKLLIEKQLIVDLFETIESRVQNYEFEIDYHTKQLAEDFPDGEIEEKHWRLEEIKEYREKITVATALQEKILKMM